MVMKSTKKFNNEDGFSIACDCGFVVACKKFIGIVSGLSWWDCLVIGLFSFLFPLLMFGIFVDSSLLSFMFIVLFSTLSVISSVCVYVLFWFLGGD